MPALQRPDRFSTEAFSSLPPAFSSPQEFAAWAAASAEAVPASRLPEQECAALDARPPEVFAAARVEPQADDHSVLAAESHESAPDDFPVESARVYSVVPPVADSSLDDSELLPAGWQAESARACSAVLALGGLARTDAHSQPEQCPDDWPEAWLQVDPVARRLQDGPWSASRVFLQALPSPSDAPLPLEAAFASGCGLAVLQDARPGPAAVSQKVRAAEVEFSWRRLAGSQLPLVAQSRDLRSQLSIPVRFRALEPQQLSHSKAPMRSAARLLEPSPSPRAVRW